MWALSSVSELGPLEIVEVYEYFDQPCLFACRSAAGQTYVSLLVDDGGGEERWWFVPVSPQRFRAVRSGQIRLRDTFLQSEDQRVFELRSSQDQHGSVSGRWLPSQSLDVSRLPLEGEHLALDEEEQPEARGKGLHDLATALRREAVSLWLDIHGLSPGLAPVARLGEILIAFQGLLDAVGQALAGRATTTGVVPLDIRRKTQMYLHAPAFSMGSFDVTLVSSEQAGLFPETQAGEALATAFELFGKQADEEQVSGLLRRLQRRVTANYELFLTAMIRSDADCSLRWASPTPERRGAVNFSIDQVRQTADVVRRIDSTIDRLEIAGKLVGFHDRLATFELLDDGDQRYEGKVLPDAVSGSLPIVIGQRYLATVIEEIEVELASGNTRSRHTLAELTLGE